MGVRARVSRCSLQRRPRRDGEEAHLGLGELREPHVGSNWLYELSAPISLQRANWIPRAGPGSKAGVALSAPLKRLLEPGELRLREKDHANVAVTSTCQTVMLRNVVKQNGNSTCGDASFFFWTETS